MFRSKNTGALIETVQWFRAWKKRNRIISPYLCVQPYYKHYGIAGEPVTVKYLSGEFSEAVESAGYEKGRWTLRLIGHKGLTDESEKDQKNNKRGHRTETARRKYQLKKIAKKVQNNLDVPK